MKTVKPLMGTLGNIEDTDQGLHCLLRQNDLKIKKYNLFGQLEIITCDTLDHPDFIVCRFMENNIKKG